MLIPTCVCGRAMEFEPGKTRSFCKAPGCGVVLEKCPEGYWAYGKTRLAFTPILPKLKVKKGVKSRAEKYRNYPKSRRKKKGHSRHK
ncbi:hypothetical protein DEAC_c13880 [Desulfosporosinus acididurans]|uniref:Uncharacterized protein n=1 Tax=Desulfosporosinus acididurans TaxID=476652 RepID=A0A0J1FTC0_9FIRM|nr:hypothetical protein DEAC_c13880 [Desulfosporosinus acididurans]